MGSDMDLRRKRETPGFITSPVSAAGGSTQGALLRGLGGRKVCLGVWLVPVGWSEGTEGAGWPGDRWLLLPAPLLPKEQSLFRNVPRLLQL